VGLLAALVLGLGLSLLVSNRILMSLGTEPRVLREALGAISDKDLTQSVDVEASDESSVAANVNRMQSALRDMVGSMRDGWQELKHSAEEISSGNMDLSNRTEETASSMAEAAHRLREVIDRVRERGQRPARCRHDDRSARHGSDRRDHPRQERAATDLEPFLAHGRLDTTLARSRSRHLHAARRAAGEHDADRGGTGVRGHESITPRGISRCGRGPP
jgi:hypothetical protein